MSNHSSVFATVRRHCCCSTAGCSDNLESQARTAFKNPLKHSIHRNTAALIQVLFNVMYYESRQQYVSASCREKSFIRRQREPMSCVKWCKSAIEKMVVDSYCGDITGPTKSVERPSIIYCIYHTHRPLCFDSFFSPCSSLWVQNNRAALYTTPNYCYYEGAGCYCNTV